jgi:hypothetical protein
VTAVLKLEACQLGPRVGFPRKEEEEHSRHVHGEQMDNTFAIKRLEDIATDQRVVNTRILVVAQVGQHMLPNVHHVREMCSVVRRVLRIPPRVLVPQQQKLCRVSRLVCP